MVDAWPAELPQNIRVDGYSENLGDGRISTKPDAGPPMSRRRSTAVPRPLAHQARLNGEQLEVLLNFSNVTLLGGSLPFTIPPTRGGGAPWLVKFDEGGLPSWVAQRNGFYLVSMRLLVLP